MAGGGARLRPWRGPEPREHRRALGFPAADRGPVDVSLPSRSGRKRRAGIHIHRPRALGPRDLSRRSDIPVTTPRRTVHDLRRTEPPERVRRAARQAQHSGYRVTAYCTRSDVELHFLAFLPPPPPTAARGQRPRRQRPPRPLHRRLPLRACRLVVETDSHAYHRGDVAFEDDHERDLTLRQLGFEVLRDTGRQLEHHGAEIAAEVRARLG